jgi:pimeloyl-ACP methyl ester carboxylesterase
MDAKLRGFQERHAALKAVRMRFFVSGEGLPILLLHGLAGGAANWADLAPPLARRHRVIVPDLPGHGGSSALPAAPNVDAYAERVRLLAEREGALPAVLVGHSFGGLVALRLALRAPHAVAGVVLAAPAGISTRRRLAQAVVEALGILRPGRLVAPIHAQIGRSRPLRYPVFAYFETSDPLALTPAGVEGFLAPQALHTDTLAAGRAMVLDDPRSDLDRLGCPALVLWGSRDRQVRIVDAFEYARRLHAPLRVIADCGHLLIGERPDACLDAIETFLDDVQAAAVSKGASSAVSGGRDRN